MAIWRRAYFAEITDGWWAGDAQVVRLRLVGSEETLRARILGRPNAEGSRAWRLNHLETGLAAANDPAFGIAIETEGRSAREIAAEIARAATARWRGGRVAPWRGAHRGLVRAGELGAVRCAFPTYRQTRSGNAIVNVLP